jgi:hypothetical protein
VLGHHDQPVRRPGTCPVGGDRVGRGCIIEDLHAQSTTERSEPLRIERRAGVLGGGHGH